MQIGDGRYDVMGAVTRWIRCSVLALTKQGAAVWAHKLPKLANRGCGALWGVAEGDKGR